MADFPMRPLARPEVRSTANPQPLQVTAQPVNQGGNIRPAEDPTLTGLVNGLSTLHPALEKWRQVDDIAKTREADTKGNALSQKVDINALPLDLTPMPETGLEGAYKSIAMDAFRRGIVERAAEKAKGELVSKYNDERTRPDFNIDTFLKENRQTNLQGLDDDMAAHMGKALVPFESSLRQDFEKVRLERLNGQREDAIGATLRNVITPDAPAVVAQKFRTDVLPVIEGLGKTKKEAAQYLLAHLSNLSTAAGGKPELFDTLSEKDAAGVTIGGLEMQPAIQAARQHAEQLRDRGIRDSAQEGVALKLKELDERVSKDPYSVNFDELLAHMGKFNVFQTGHEVASYWAHVMRARADQAGQQNLLGLAKAGQLFMAEEKDQKATMGALTGPVVQGLSAAIEKGDASSVAGLSDALIAAHRTAGSNVPSAPIERMFKFIGEGNAKGDVPPPIFKAAVEVYRKLESAPQLRDAYFNEKTQAVLGAYVQGLYGGNAEEGAAYKSAFESVSPEAKRRAEAFKQTPEYREKLQSATRWVTGSSWVPSLVGGNGRPENSGELVGAAQEFALDFLKRSPQATDQQVQDQTKAYIERSFVHDPTTGIAVKVPPNFSAEVTQQAITAYTSKVSKELDLNSRGAGWGLMLLPTNINQGTYRVLTSFNGAPVHFVNDLKMGDLVEQHRRDTLWLPADAQVLKSADVALNTGKSLSEFASTLPGALAKARQLKVQPELVQKLEAHEFKATADALKNIPATDFNPDNSVLFKDNRAVKVDPKQSVASAQRLLNSSQGGSTGLAASLIAMGEGVAFSAYDDPAKGAGKNIGMGYNLKANAATAERDLRAAGVPSEQVPAVLSGTGKLSPEQAERLVLVTVGRHEAAAQAQVNSLQPRLWERLQPQQRAVLTDIAYQTGDVGQFKKAISALVVGDLEKFRHESRVFYTDRKGERAEDTRRNALRDAMLAGSSYWQAVLTKQGAQPSSPLDAVALSPAAPQ
jgi:hypothetical protein